jgi:serine protease Do
MGIISVADRYLEGGALPISPFNTWIQTDAAINPGNSGGPLVNLRGEVIGVNARKLSEAENVGFAIPINVVKEVVEAIKKDGRVKRSSVGVNLQEMHAKTSDPTKEGVVIADVDTLSPANQAQIRPGDILLAVNGAPVDARFAEDLPPVRKRIADLPVGEKAVFTVLRGDKKIDIDVVTEESGAPRGKEVELSEWGMSIAELTPDIVRAAQLTARKGVIVSGVQVGGIAANAHLDQGDIILKLDDAEVANLDQFMTKYRELVSAKKRLTMLFVKHAALTRFVIVKQEAADAPVQAGGNGNAQ